MFARHMYKDVTLFNKVLAHVKWNCDGSLLSTIANDKHVRIAHLDSNGTLHIVQTIPTSAQMLQTCWHPLDPNKFALLSDEKTVEIWDMRGSKPSLKLTSLGGNISLAWSPSGHYIALSNKSDYLLVFDTRTGTLVKKKKIKHELNEIGWTRQSDHLVAAVSDENSGGAALISFLQDDLDEIESITAHSASAFFLEVDPQQRRMAIGSHDCCITLWDLQGFSCIQTLPLEVDIRSMSFSGDGRYLAIACDDPSILICDAVSGEPLARVPGRSKTGFLAWHPSLPLIALACDDRSSNPISLKLLSFPSPSPA